MKRRVRGVSLGLLLSIGALLGFSMPAHAVSTNAFTITSYDISYTLSRDDDKRSVLETHERITANFVLPRANHGLERVIPESYQGHPTNPKIVSVQDETGQPLQYSKASNGDATTLRIGDPDHYVTGLHTYDIVYTQRDVTNYFANTDKTEWYWDTNGTQWRVPIEQFSVSIFMDDSIKKDLKTDPICYAGQEGETGRCVISEENGRYVLSQSNVMPGGNFTVNFGFTKDAFAPYEKGPLEWIIAILLVAFLISIVIFMISIIILSSSYARRRNRQSELKPIPVEYIPPKEASVTLSAQMVPSFGSVFSAQLIDFAVRHYIEIIETKTKSAFRPAEYDIKIIRDVSDLYAEELEILSDMFGRIPEVGERLALKKLRYDYAYSARTIDNDGKLRALITGEYGLRALKGSDVDRAYFMRWGVVLLILGTIGLMPLLLIPALVAFVLRATIRPLTDKGLALRRYLMGLDEYIKAAEAERLKMLQGPETAEKVGEAVDTADPGQIIKLYERVLPYAILFGREKEWSKAIGVYYEQHSQSPDWYSGTSTFNAVAFTSAISSFSYAASSSSGHSSSSSSGGSSGGGSSGGGGGGGGGGGW